MRGGIRGLLINFLQGAAVCRAEAMPAFRAPARADSRTTSKLLGTRGAGLIPVLLLRYLSCPPFQPFPCWLTAHPHKMCLFKDGKCQAWFSEPFFFLQPGPVRAAQGFPEPSQRGAALPAVTECHRLSQDCLTPGKHHRVPGRTHFLGDVSSAS